MPTRHTQVESELSLAEMLADPIVQAVMARDGITKGEVEGLIGVTRGKLASRQSETRHTGWQLSSAFGE